MNALPQSQENNELQSIIDYIYSIDFSKIIDKLVKHGDWLRKDAEETCELYKNFLFLTRKYQDQYSSLPPSEDIDEFWHAHILDTQAYIRDCNIIFGQYLHHYPYFGIDEETDRNDLDNAFDITQKLHFQEFGKYIPTTRSAYPKLVYSLMKKLDKEKK